LVVYFIWPPRSISARYNSLAGGTAQISSGRPAAGLSGQVAGCVVAGAGFFTLLTNHRSLTYLTCMAPAITPSAWGVRRIAMRAVRQREGLGRVKVEAVQSRQECHRTCVERSGVGPADPAGSRACVRALNGSL